FVRVRDKSTGHQFDVAEGDRRIGGAFELLNRKGYPPSPVIRPAKHHVRPTGSASTRKTESAEAGMTDKEA
ncbi:hypothetical protein NL459_28705, partial [Klebsiella pneumoniae]|nr:hypothetical protein [Klebsiella pneumoniae]